MPVRYKLRYLPLFFEDISSVVEYIRIVLKNDIAADNLINAVEKAIKDRLPVCESFEQFESAKDRINPYYRIYVKNFIVFYVVITDGKEKIMEVRRFVYNKQLRDNI